MSKKICRIVETILEDIDSEIPIDVHKVADFYNIEVKERAMESDVSGMLVIKDDNPVICINESHHPNRQRFSIAHELGHYFLHKDKSNIFVDGAFYRNRKSEEGTDKHEIEANQFAAELLMPADLLEEEYDLLQNEFFLDDDFLLEKLAKKFEVSVQAISIRLAKLDLIETPF